MKSGEVYPSKYLKAEELDEEITLTIKKVVLEEMESKEGRSQEKPVAYFKEISKGLVVNKTNWSIIAKQHGDESDEWAGKQVTLFVMDVEAFGEMVSAIRVKPPRVTKGKPAAAPVVEGVTTAAELPADNELITRYWTTVKNLGLNRAKGLEILKGAGGNFEVALIRIESDEIPF